MSDVLEHHGILGMRWGVRRTPAQLGHPTSGNGSGYNRQSTAENSKNDSKNPSGKSSNDPREMTDEELRQRINRLNMEEQYENLVARQKERNTGPIKKALGKALDGLGQKLLGVAVDKIVDKISNKGDKGDEEDEFDINDWKDKDVNMMDVDTIDKVAKWYKNAKTIINGRDAGPSTTTPKSDGSSKSDSSSSSSSPNNSQLDRWLKERRSAMRSLGVR